MEVIQMTDTIYTFLTGLPKAAEHAVCATCGGTADRRYDGDAVCETCVVTGVGIWITTCPTCHAGPDQPCVMTDGGYDLGRIHAARERAWDHRRGVCPTCRVAEGEACVGSRGRIRSHVHATRRETKMVQKSPEGTGE